VLDNNGSVITLVEGKLALKGQNLTVTGTGGDLMVNDGGNLELYGDETVTLVSTYPTLDTGSTVTYTGDGDAGADTYTITVLEDGYSNLVINSTDGATDTFQLGTALDVNGNFTLTAGKVDVVSGQNYAVNVAGNWSNSGTFTARSGTVTLDGVNQTLTGATSFYNLTKSGAAAAVLTLPASTTQTIANTLTLTGASDQLLSLRSSVEDTQANIDPQGSSLAQYVDVQDSNNIDGAAVMCTIGCVDSLNNTNWTFAGITISSISGNTTEAGGTATFTVTLASEPTENISFDIATSDATEGSLSVSTVTFTTLDWNTPQNITVTGVNDDLDDGDIAYSIITDTISSSDPSYGGVNPGDVSVTNTDNDTSGFTVSSISGNTTEDGGQATYTVALTAQPTATVTIGVTSSNTAEGTVSPASLAFTTVNWASAQTVTVTGINDALDDGDIGYTLVNAAATSADGNYSGLNPTDVSATNTDNDTSGFTVSAISADTTEAGGTATFTVVLTVQPSADVSFALATNDATEGTASPASLTFTSLDWDTPQLVTVTGINYDIDDGDIAYSIVTEVATSADLAYNGLNPGDVSVTNSDNDTFGFSVSAISGNTTEAGGTATYTVVLNTEPTATVTTGITSSDTGEGTVSPASLEFTALDWATPQTVTVTGVNDDIDDGDIAYTLVNAAATSADGNYSGLNPADVSATNIDNDTAGFTVSAISGNTTEAGGTATYTVVLNTLPTATVNVGITSNDTTEGTVSPSSLAFTTINWASPQTVTVTGVNDAVDDGDIAYTLVNAAASSVDGSYNGLNPDDVSATNVDNDTFGFTVSAISENTTEDGGTATYTVVLNTQPTATVTVGVTSDDTGEGTVSPSSLSFTTVNWATPKTVTVTGVNDDLDDGDIAYTLVNAAATSADVNYGGANPDDVAATNTDNDEAGFTVSAISGNTTEAGATATYTVVLNTAPTATVTIGVTSNDTSEGTVSPASLEFTTGNWATPQTVTVTGVNDDFDDGDVAYTLVNAAATSADAGYNGLNPSDVSATNVDNDTNGFTVSVISGNTTEAGGTATYTIALNTEPAATVTIGVTSNDTGEGAVSPASLEFTTENWATPQTVTVTGVNDDVDDGNIDYTLVNAAATSADGDYDGLNPDDVAATNTDDDTAGFTVSAISGNTTEVGGTATYTVVLNTQPTATVNVGVTSSDTTEGTVSPASLAFSTVSWATPQTVTVTGVDDDIDDGDVGYTLVNAAATSADGNYSGLNPADVSATNTDNDTAGFTVSAISGNTTETGGTATYTVALNTEPTATVNVGVTSADTTEGTVSPSSLAFSTENWATPQTVTITGVNDVIDDGDVVYTLVNAAATSADGTYNGLNPDDVSATNSDNDISGYTVSAISGNTTEAGVTATFTVALNTEPVANVSFNLATNDATEGTAAPSALTFTTENWATPQTVTVTGVNDDLDDGDVVYSIVTAAASSSDVGYSGLNSSDVTVTNTDDDVSGFTVSTISGNTTEAGGTGTYSVVLTAEPTATVTVAVTSNNTDEGTVSPAQLEFTAVNWDSPQTVTVTGVNDDVDDGDIAYLLVNAAATSVDGNYNALNPDDVSATNTDNDTVGITVGAISGNTVEDGTVATFTVVLNTQPTGDVEVDSVSSNSAEGVVTGGATLTFTSVNWGTPQTVTVTGQDDALNDGNIDYTIQTLTDDANTLDAAYDAVDPADVAVTNEDDEVSGVVVSAISGNTTEAGGTATFTVVLSAFPTGDVQVDSVTSDSSEGTVTTGASLTFTTLNWNTPQTVTVTGVGDDLDDGNIGYTILTATNDAASTDDSYDAIDPADVSVTNNDDDTLGVTVSAISGNTTEGGATATFTVVLGALPTASVSMGVATSDATEGAVTSSGSLTFTVVDWNVPQTVTVLGQGDEIDDGDVLYSIVVATATSLDLTYNGLNPADVSVFNTDDDTANVVMIESDDTTEVDELGTTTDSYTLVLTSEPTSDVAITLADNAGQISLAEDVFIFTNVNWDTPQTVTVMAVDDSTDEASPHSTIIEATIESLDDVYAGFAVSDLTVLILDDDTSTSSGGSSVIQKFVTAASIELTESATACEGTGAVTVIARARGAVRLYLSNDPDFLVQSSYDFEADPLLAEEGIDVMSLPWTMAGGTGSQTVYAIFVSSTNNRLPVIPTPIALGICDQPVEPPEEEIPELPTEPLFESGISPYDGVTVELVDRLIEGEVFKGEHYATVFILQDGQRRPYLDESSYYTWYRDFSNVRTVTDVTLTAYLIGSPVLPSPGRILVKLDSEPEVYLADSKNTLHHIMSEEDAKTLLGPAWDTFVYSLPSTVFKYYVIGESISSLIPWDIDYFFTWMGLQAKDFDRDGLTDAEETLLGTDPESNDTDGDRLPDHFEVKAGTDPLKRD